MKKIKVFSVIFAITLLISSNGIIATTQQAYAGISLPALKKELTQGPEIKTTTESQYYYNFSTLNSCTNNNNKINVKVKSSSSTSYNTEIAVGDKNSLTDTNGNTRELRAYNVIISNAVFSPCEAYHSGIWYYN